MKNAHFVKFHEIRDFLPISVHLVSFFEGIQTSTDAFAYRLIIRCVPQYISSTTTTSIQLHFFQDNLGKPVPGRYQVNHAGASAGPYTDHFHLAANK